MRAVKIASLLVALAVVAMLLFVPLPFGPLIQRWPALAHEVENFGHPVVFACLAVIALPVARKLFPAHPFAYLVVVFAGLVFFGLATEAVQAHVGRDASWDDFRHDILGTLFGLLWCARATARSNGAAPPVRLALGATQWLVASVAAAPLAWTICAYLYRNAQMPVLWREQSILFSRFAAQRENRYAGLEIEEPAADWRNYRELQITAKNLLDHSTVIRIRVNDRVHAEQSLGHYSEPIVLPAGGLQTVRIPLERIRMSPVKRALDLETVRGIFIFQDAHFQPPTFKVTEVRLLR
jgi:VanZ family protein